MTWPAYLPHDNRLNPEGQPRRFGLEIEFSSIELEDAVQVVSNYLGRRPTRLTRYEWLIETARGAFRVERDITWLKELTRRQERGESLSLGDRIKQTAAPAAKTVMPLELVAPPLRFEELTMLDELTDLLGSAGALGTSDRLYYAFGIHVNAESWSHSPATLTRVVQAFGMVQRHLFQALEIDETRRLTTFINPYPDDYLALILDPDYRPEIEGLIRDYIEFNPTRNRGLDLLVLFATLDDDLVRGLLPDEEINARPAFHFRLPNSRVGTAGWRVSDQLRAWAFVEQLACDPHLFARAMRDLRQRIARRSLLPAKPDPGSDWLRQLHAKVDSG